MGVEDQLIVELGALALALEKMRPLCRWQYHETECDPMTKAHRVKFRSFQLRERHIREQLGLDVGRRTQQ